MSNNQKSHFFAGRSDEPIARVYVITAKAKAAVVMQIIDGLVLSGSFWKISARGQGILPILLHLGEIEDCYDGLVVRQSPDALCKLLGAKRTALYDAIDSLRLNNVLTERRQNDSRRERRIYYIPKPECPEIRDRNSLENPFDPKSVADTELNARATKSECPESRTLQFNAPQEADPSPPPDTISTDSAPRLSRQPLTAAERESRRRCLRSIDIGGKFDAPGLERAVESPFYSDRQIELAQAKTRRAIAKGNCPNPPGYFLSLMQRPLSEPKSKCTPMPSERRALEKMPEAEGEEFLAFLDAGLTEARQRFAAQGLTGLARAEAIARENERLQKLWKQRDVPQDAGEVVSDSERQLLLELLGANGQGRGS